MQERPIRVLLVDDEEDSYVLTRHLLNAIPGERFELEWAPTYADGMRAIGRGDYDICLVDQRLDCGEGLELIRRAVSNGCRAPMILLTAYGDRQTDLRAMEGGAAAYLDKARLEAPVLERAIRYAIHHASRYQRLAEQARRLRQEMSERYEMVGESEPMRAVYDLIARVAPTRAGVLICGESGTGKEMVARAIHMNSNLADGPLEIVNCAAVPPGLIESELFGHVRGAFTGAVSDRPSTG